MWLRVTLLCVIAAWSVYAAIRHEKRVLGRLARAARGRVGRALAVVTAYYVALVAILGVCGLAAAIVHDAGSPTAAVVVLLVGVTVTAPFMWILAPKESFGAATSFSDLRRRGAPKKVARAIAYPAVAYYFVLLLPAMGGAVFAVCVLE